MYSTVQYKYEYVTVLVYRGPARREFIMSKYVQRKFIIRTSFAGTGAIIQQQPRPGAPGARRPQSTLLVVNTDLKFDLRQAVCAADLSSLLQVYAEGSYSSSVSV